MTGNLEEDAPRLPLRKEFEIFCFGWVGAILLVFLMALIGFEEGDQTLREFLYECLDAIIVFMVAGILGFLTVMVVLPFLAAIYDAVDWFGRILLLMGVGVLCLTLLHVSSIITD